MCNKERFKHWQTRSILKNIKKKSPHRREKRAYYCSKCNAWHLTSLEDPPNTPPPIQFQPLEQFKKYIKQTINEENPPPAPSPAN